MTTRLHDALTELADEITPDDVPAGLAASAWGAADLERRRARRTRALGALATAAVAALAFWLVISAGTGLVDSSPADSPTEQVGLPQRVSFQEDPPDLPPTGEPLAGVVRMGSRGAPPTDPTSRDTTNGGSPWQALTGDGRLWTLGDDVAPTPTLPEGLEHVTPVAPALSPDGQRLALPLMVERVIHEDSRGRTGETVSVKVDVHHVTTGQHETLEICGDQCVLSVLRWSPDGRSLAVLAYDERGPVLMTRSMLDGGAELKETRLEDVALQVALAGWTDDSTVVVVPLTDSLSLGVDGWVTPVEIDARSGEVSRLPRLLVAENALDETLEPDSVTVVDGSLAVGTAWDGGPQWWVSELGEGQGFVDSFTAPTLDGPGGTGGTARLLHGLPRGDGAVITRAATGGPAYVITDRVDHDPALLTVMAPALDVQDIVLAADAPGGPVTTHPLGTRTSWWSWHPEMAAGLALTPFALIGTWFVVRRLRSRRG